MPVHPITRVAAALALAAMALPARAEASLDGLVRVRADLRTPATRGPLAQASQLAPELVAPAPDSAAIETEWRGRWQALATAVALREERPRGGAWHGDATVNELHASGEAFGWQFSAGRKVVAWDVGYGFRPNDVVQQEARRALLPGALQGRGLVQAEHFTAETALSLAWVNPQRAADTQAAFGADEQALALRAYRRAGAADLHGFARWGERTRGSVGAAASWVASDSVELHGSARWADRADVLAPDPALQGLVSSSPYRPVEASSTVQALVGATWTGEQKLSLMGEAWYDGTAAGGAQWDAWAERNRRLAAAWVPGGPDALRRGVAGNLAWQAQAFGGQSLRRGNVFLRAAWEHEGWQPSLDLLLMPADRGRAVTAALAWQGDRVRLDAGWRAYGGPAGSVAAQLPNRRVGYLAATLSF
jgi:hypothetical protein